MKRVTAMLLSGLLIGAAATCTGAEVAIVVNRSNPIDELSLKDLRAIFELQQQFWKNGKRVSLVIQKAGQPEKKLMLEKVYNSTEEALKRYWMNKMFKAEISAIPQPRASNDEVKQVVSQLPNGIGFIDATTVDSSVKVVRIDGLLPGDQGYLLKSEDAEK